MADKKAFTTLTLHTLYNYGQEPREVGVTSGRGGVSLWIAPDPRPYTGEKNGLTNLTPAQARELAQDLIERADEIEANPL